MLAIETEALCKRLGGRTVVDAVSLSVPEGCVYGFLGPNGAGKTSVMRLLLGLLRADSGRARLLGHDIACARRAALSGVGAFLGSASLYPHLSGHANLTLTRRLLGLPATEVERVLELVDLRSAAGQRVGGYSLGMQQRLAIARALLGTPRLLLLDEPTNGLDPDGIMAMRQLIRALPDRIGGTVFVSSHLLGEVEQVADRAGLMLNGRLVLEGPLATLVGAGRTVRIDVAEAERARALLCAAGLEAVAAGEGALRIACSADGPAVAARANRLLVEAGMAVSAVVPEVRSLEDVYQRAVAAGEMAA